MGFSFGNAIAAIEDPHIRACLQRLGRESHASSSTLSTVVRNAIPVTSYALSTVNVIAGSGLTGGGSLLADRTFNVGAGFGITVAADSVAVNQAMVPTWTGIHTFTARDVHNGGITNLSTTAVQFTNGYDASNGMTFDTTSSGSTTILLPATSATATRFALKPTGTAATNGMRTFEVQDFSGNPRLWVARTTGANALAHVVRLGFDASNYVQFNSGVAAATTTTVSVVGSPSMTFSAPLLLNDVRAAAFNTAAPTSNIGFTFTGVAPTSNIGFVFNTTAPLFNSVNPTFATTAANTGQYFEWPITSPATMKMRFGVFSQTFNSRLDNAMVQSYNINPTSGVKDATGEHAYALQFEGDFHPSGTAGDDQAEYNWSYTTPGNPGTNWRPFTHELKVAENTITGQAYFTWTPNNLNSGNNRYLELSFPWVAINRDSTLYSAPVDNSVASFMCLRNFASSGGGGACFGQTSNVYTDASVSFNNSNIYGHAVRIDFTPGSKTLGYFAAYSVRTPVAPGAGTTVQGLIGTRVEDLRIDLLTDGQAYQIDSQTVSNGAQGNLLVAGVGYNHGHIQLGAWHLWDSNSGTLRAKGSTPTSDGDGNAILSLATPATGGSATAGALYTATEQAMLQAAYDVLRTMGALT